MKNISILGATGSVGTQTLEVIRESKDKFSLVAVSANKSFHKVVEILKEFKPKFIAIMDEDTYLKLKNYCSENNYATEVLCGMEGLKTIATLEEIDVVVTSIVGMIGLEPTLCAIRAGKDIALANKETLVVGGAIVMEEARKHGVKILPVDSEHSAIFQALQGNSLKEVGKVILTASGGPFRGRTLEELKSVTVEEALKHPKWNMGQKISIDSATLVNKGLEVIEAHWLFNASYDDIEVVVHPQSIVHSMVEYRDGSVMAQLGCPDMKLPIQYALNYPNRYEAVVEKLDFYKLGSISFEKPDMDTFKGLALAFKAGRAGGLIPTIYNGANEACVQLFLDRKISYLQITEIIEECMNMGLEGFEMVDEMSIENIIKLDSRVREYIISKYDA